MKESRKRIRLTKRDKLFCEIYISNGYKSKAAAELAGYKPERAATAAWRLLQRPEINKYIDDKTLEVFKTQAMTPEQAIKRISDIASGQVKDIKVDVRLKDGYMEVPATLDIQLKAMDMLLKAAGEYINKQEITVNGQIDHYIDADNERELVDRLAKRHGYQTITAEIIQEVPAIPESTA